MAMLPMRVAMFHLPSHMDIKLLMYDPLIMNYSQLFRESAYPPDAAVLLDTRAKYTSCNSKQRIG